MNILKMIKSTRGALKRSALGWAAVAVLGMGVGSAQADISNGGFETGDFPDWTIDATTPAPVIDSGTVHSGSYAAFLGNVLHTGEANGDSSISQLITDVPSGSTLHFWVYRESIEAGGDWQDAYITDASGTILETIFHVQQTDGEWVEYNKDLFAYAGQDIRIKFLVHGDGYGVDWETNMRVDDVTITGAAPAEILTFGPGAVITGTNIVWTVPYGTTVETLAPVYTLSSGGCDQPNGAIPDPPLSTSSPVTYIVTYGEVANAYAVTVTVANGLNVSTYLGLGNNDNDGPGLVDPISNLMAKTPTATGIQIEDIHYHGGTWSVPGSPSGNNFSILWEGWFDVTKDGWGTYTFGTSSDDGSVIYMDLNEDGDFADAGEYIVNNNKYQGDTPVVGTVTLNMDSVHMVIGFYEGSGGYDMSAGFRKETWSNFSDLRFINGTDDYFYPDNPYAAPTAKITAFGPGAAVGAVVDNAAAIAWTVPYGTAVTNLAPSFTLSTDAKCYSNSSCAAEVQISSGTPFDFTDPVHYFVVSSDSLITNDYTVTVSVTPVSTAKEITSFSILGIAGTFDGFNIAQNVPFGTDVTTLVPVYTVSQFATGSPTNGAIVDFTSPVTYTVTAQDSSTNDYTVTVTELPDNPVTINIAYLKTMDGVASYQEVGSASRAAPLAYRGATWNDGGNGGAAVSDLKDSTNASTGISVSQVLRNHGTHSFSGLGGNKLVSAGLGFGAWSAGDGAIMGQFQDILTFSGMDMSHSYDIAFALPANGGRTAIYKYGALEAPGPCADLSDWTVDQNYALLAGCIPRTDGKVTIQMNCNGIDWSAFCGVQLLDNGVRATQNSEALIYSFSSLAGAGPVTMAGTDISMVMASGSSVSALVPTFTMSGGAACTLATVGGDPIVSGTTPVDFTSPVHFIVKSEDGVTTTDYTVTVNLVAPSGKVYVNIDAALRTGLVGPAGGLGETWNQKLGGPITASALLDSVGTVTTVAYGLSQYWGPDAWGPPLDMLKGGAWVYGWATPTLQISGLTAGKQYDVYIASAYVNEGGYKHYAVFATANSTVSSSPQTAENNGGDGSTWIRGQNYVLFEQVRPDVDGKIIFNLSGVDGKYVTFNGFQLVEIPPGGTVIMVR
ncbi:MAG: hypothetical protein WCK89_01110 [bacterium]